jgi:GNAT superfamily N-acetyltransferase
MIKTSIIFKNGTDEDSEFLDSQLEQYNLTSKPLTQPEAYYSFVKIAKNDQGEVIGGAVAYSSMYHIGYLDTLWVDERYRGQGIGTELLKQAEQALLDFGCPVCHLDTFDFQGPEFYRNAGYTEFGRLEHEHVNLTEFFLYKKLK